jgi:GntR family transcriptional regulator/MocR family aminotransferase
MMDTAQAVPIALVRTIAGPLHQQIVARVRAAIASGMLAPGARLPASRVFATQLGVARGTVETAYALLAGAGAIIPQGAAGTMVSPDLAGRAATPTRPEIARRGASLPPPEPARPFCLGLPTLDAFPRTLWARWRRAKRGHREHRGWPTWAIRTRSGIRRCARRSQSILGCRVALFAIRRRYW